MARLVHLTDDDLQRAIDRELDARRQAALEAHLSGCATCRARRAYLEQGAQLVEDVAPADRDDVWMARARARLRQELARGVPPSGTLGLRWRSTIAWPTAAAVMAAVAVGIVILRGGLAPAPGVAGSDHADGVMLPIARLTPGATWDVAVDELCADSRREQRPVSEAVRARVLRDYDMQDVPATEYELDYLITPALGGAPDARNLWPQRYGSPIWSPHVKDQLERRLARMVCAGALPLEAAQRDLASNWIAAYKKYFRTETPLDAHRAGGVASDPSGDEPLLYPVWRAGDAMSVRLLSFSR